MPAPPIPPAVPATAQAAPAVPGAGGAAQVRGPLPCRMRTCAAPAAGAAPRPPADTGGTAPPGSPPPASAGTDALRLPPRADAARPPQPRG